MISRNTPFEIALFSENSAATTTVHRMMDVTSRRRKTRSRDEDAGTVSVGGMDEQISDPHLSV
jgi:hypothetical protein